MRGTRRGTDSTNKPPEFEVPGSLPVDAFASPLHAQPAQPAAKRGRAPWMIVASALLASAGGVAIALAVRAGRSEELPRIQREVRVAASPRAPQAALARSAPARTPGAALARTGAAPPARTGAIAPGAGATTAAPAQPPQPRAAERRPEPQPRRSAARERRPAPAKAGARAAEETRAALPHTPSRAQVIAAMQRVTPAVEACFGTTHGTVRVAVTVLGATGRITTAKVTGRGGRVGSCIARAVRRARLPKFEKRKLEISYPFVH